MRISMNKTALVTAAIGIVFVVYISFGRIAVWFISRACNLDISYISLRHTFPARFWFKGLTVLERKTGFGFFSRSAEISPCRKGPFFKDFAVDFDLRDVNFTKRSGREIASYDNLTELVAIPFASSWIYNRVSGSLRPVPNGMEVNRLSALSDDIRLKASTVIHYDGNLKSDITISFSGTITQKIPKELSNMLLKQEAEGWKSLSVSLSGNYRSPSIRVSGNLFRLSIEEASI